MKNFILIGNHSEHFKFSVFGLVELAGLVVLQEAKPACSSCALPYFGDNI